MNPPVHAHTHMSTYRNYWTSYQLVLFVILVSGVLVVQFDSGEVLVEYDDNTKLCLQATADTGVQYASLNGQWRRWAELKTSRNKRHTWKRVC